LLSSSFKLFSSSGDFREWAEHAQRQMQSWLKKLVDIERRIRSVLGDQGAVGIHSQSRKNRLND